MIHTDVTISCTCTYCDKKIDDDEEIILCPSCEENGWQEVVKASVRYALEHEYVWKDKDDYVGFDSEKEHEAFMLGLAKGVSDALFWVCDRQDMVGFYEEEVMPKLKC